MTPGQVVLLIATLLTPIVVLVGLWCEHNSPRNRGPR